MGLFWLVPLLPSSGLGMYWTVPFIIVWMIFRLLQLLSSPERPRLYYKNSGSPFVRAILEKCPILTEVFKPTILWGKSGHFQTIVHVKMGRTKPRWPDAQRFHILMPDGATMSYDLFDPHEEGHRAKFTLALCPGIANSSECIYLRTFASYAQTHGFRVAILNHLGALKSEKLTSPRVFTYGGTGEYSRMVDHLLEQYPETKILAVGFSMGGNIVTKYLGESLDNQKKVLCGVSVCQGYEINEAKDLFMQWANLRRIYTFFMTLNQRRLLSRHREFLFSEKAQQKCGTFKEKETFSATSLVDVDENYSRIRAGFKSAFDYYKRHSSAYVMKNIKVPMLIMNSADDPIVPPPLYKHPRQFVEKNENCIFMTTKHGGHLGFFEGGMLVPENVTWLDRVIIEYADAVTSLYIQGNLPQQTGSLVLSPEKGEADNMQETTFDSGIADLSWEGRSFSSEGSASPEMEVKDSGKDVADGKKKDSLKRGSLLKQASTYVQ